MSASGPAGDALAGRNAADAVAVALPAAVHRPIMPAEVLRHLAPAPGQVVVDCTLGGGGHAEAILPRLLPGGRLIGIDVDRRELVRTEARLRALGFDAQVFSALPGNFVALSAMLTAAGVSRCDAILVDLGISSMQAGGADRGFSYKVPGPLDMRMDQGRGAPAWQVVAQCDEATIARLLATNADEPHATVIAHLMKTNPIDTTQALERCVRVGLAAAVPGLTKPQVKMSVRRTFQALRIAVNDELAALDGVLAEVPRVLAPAGRVVILTFHSGEDRRVKQAFRTGRRAGVFASIATRVTRASKEDTRANRRASSAKLRWAVRAG